MDDETTIHTSRINCNSSAKHATGTTSTSNAAPPRTRPGPQRRQQRRSHHAKPRNRVEPTRRLGGSTRPNRRTRRRHHVPSHAHHGRTQTTNTDAHTNRGSHTRRTRQTRPAQPILDVLRRLRHSLPRTQPKHMRAKTTSNNTNKNYSKTHGYEP